MDETRPASVTRKNIQKEEERTTVMRVLLINTSERIGGAAIAASRLMESLKNHGIKAKLLVRDKQTDQISVVSLDHNWRMVWKFVWGAHRHLERQPLQQEEHLCRRHCQHGDRHHLTARIPASRRHPSALDKPRDALAEEHREDSRLGQARRLDHARHVALHWHLSPCPRVHPLPAGMPQLPLHPRRRRQT